MSAIHISFLLTSADGGSIRHGFEHAPHYLVRPLLRGERLRNRVDRFRLRPDLRRQHRASQRDYLVRPSHDSNANNVRGRHVVEPITY